MESKEGRIKVLLRLLITTYIEEPGENCTWEKKALYNATKTITVVTAGHLKEAMHTFVNYFMSSHAMQPCVRSFLYARLFAELEARLPPMMLTFPMVDVGMDGSMNTDIDMMSTGAILSVEKATIVQAIWAVLTDVVRIDDLKFSDLEKHMGGWRRDLVDMIRNDVPFGPE